MSTSHPAFTASTTAINTIKTDPVLAKVGDDEPIFVLRARDKDAPATILQWVDSARAAGVPEHRLVRAMNVAHQMIDWQINNGCKHVD